MPRNNAPFTAGERRVGLFALIAVVVLTFGMMALDSALSPSLGVYGMPASSPSSLPGVIDARPLQ